MNRHFNSHLRTALFFVFWLLSTVEIGGSALINNPTNQPSRKQEIPIPADGDCLYKSIMVAYLLPVVNDADLFNKRPCHASLEKIPSSRLHILIPFTKLFPKRYVKKAKK